MMRKKSVAVGLMAALYAGVAHAVPDECDSGGGHPVVVASAIDDAETNWVPAVAKDYLGWEVATGDFNGDGISDVAMSAVGDDTNGSDSGAVYITLSWSASLFEATDVSVGSATVTMYGEGRLDRAGYSLSNAGDVCGDGRDDLLVGTFAKEGLSGGAGQVYLVCGATIEASGGTIDLLTQADAVIVGAFVGDEFGTEVAGVGDVNNDGFDDFVVGAPNYSDISPGRGAAFLFFGPVSGTLFAGTDEGARIDGAQSNSSFGIAIAGIGDTDNDGFDDFVIGAPRDTTAAAKAGAVYVFEGGASLPSVGSASAASVRLYGTQYDRLGGSVAAAGDDNGDLLADFWVGAKQAGSYKRGEAYLINGVTGNYSGRADAYASITITSSIANSLVGTSIVGNVDLNYDGVNDVIVGAERGAGIGLDTGVAYIGLGPFHTVGGTIIGTDPTKMGTIQGLDAGSFFGRSIAAGDVNLDGFDDVLVGAWKSSEELYRGGYVVLHRGGADTADLATFYRDVDVDGFGTTADTIEDCTPPFGYVANSTDCNDADGAYFPGAFEGCSDPDYNCDGFTGPTDNDGDLVTACGGDCNDGDAQIHPGADEKCGDGVDNNCDGAVDDASAADAVPYFPDVDGDGYGDDALRIDSCTPIGGGTISTGGDCDDADGTVNPSIPERCGDGIDNDCDSNIDDALAFDAPLWFYDGDSDLNGDGEVSVRGCVAPPGYVANRLDCDDNDPLIAPTSVETCDYKDNDCFGLYYLGGPVAASKSTMSMLGAAANNGLHAAAFIPDFDFDGDDELVLASPNSNEGASSAGAVYIRKGDPTEMADFDLAQVRSNGAGYVDIKFLGDRLESRFGTAVAVGDMNGDGFADLAVGAPTARVPNLDQGGVYIYFGPLSSYEGAVWSMSDADLILRGEKGGDRFGTSLAFQDTNGDGYAELIVGAPTYTGTVPKQGRVYVVPGAASGLGGNLLVTARASATMTGTENTERLGDAVFALQDLDGDGFGDFGVGAPQWGSLDRGRVSVVYGSGGAHAGALTPSYTVIGRTSVENVGVSMVNVGDFNADGNNDVLFGTSRNTAYLALGTGTRRSGEVAVDTIANVRFTGSLGQGLGRHVARVGDFNNDNFDDLAISAADDDINGPDRGAVFLIYGRNDVTEIVPFGGSFEANKIESFGRYEPGVLFPVYRASDRGVFEGAKIYGVANSDAMGLPVGGGDFNGDGIPDLATSALGVDRDPLNTNAGAAYLFPGGSYGTDVILGDLSQSVWFWDNDADDYTTLSTFPSCPMHVPVSWRVPSNPKLRGKSTPTAEVDCDDNNWRIYPGAPETEGSDGVDSDCDGYDLPNVLPILTVDLKPNAPLSTDTLTADVTIDDPDTETTPITLEFVWYRNGTPISGQSGQSLLPTLTSKGDDIEVCVRADDTRGLTDWVCSLERIGNSRPTIDSCTITPSAVGVTTDMTAVAAGLTDDDPADGPFLVVNYQWRKQSFPSWTPIPGETATTLQSCKDREVDVTNPNWFAINCVRGSVLDVTCTPFDGALYGTPIVSAPVEIQNTKPVIETCRINESGPYTNTPLTASGTGTDVDSEAVTISFEWIINSIPTGVTSPTLGSSYTSHYDNVQLRCTPRDQYGDYGTPVTTAPLNILNTPPTGPTINLEPNLPLSNQDLFVTILTASTDIDGDLITYEYRWLKNGAEFLNPTYPTSQSVLFESNTTKGDTWRVEVTPFDGAAYGPSHADQEVIRNTPPTLDSAAINPVTPESRQTLQSLTVNFQDHDNDPDLSEIRWYVNGSFVHFGPSLAPNLALRGDNVYITIRAYDGEGYGPTRTSPILTVLNSPPEAIVLDDMSPIPAGQSDDIDCNVAFPSTDFDLDAITYRVEFVIDRPNDPFLPPSSQTFTTIVAKDTSNVVGTTGNAWYLPSTSHDFGDQVRCHVTPNDGTVNGPISESNALSVQDNLIPPAPVINAIERYRNTDVVRLAGQCRDFPLDCLEMYYDCENDSGTSIGPQLGDCDTDLFSEDVTLARGFTWTCWAWCEDIGTGGVPNRSINSASRVTEICAEYDAYELMGVGNVQGDAVDFATDLTPWPALFDNNTASYTVTGNVIGTVPSDTTVYDDTYDWYLFKTTDNYVTDRAAGRDAYNFEVAFTSGASSYQMKVFRDIGAGSTLDFCSLDTDGYDRYNFFNEDSGDYTNFLHHGPIPSDKQACAKDLPGPAGTQPTWPQYNSCDNLTSNYYVRVNRTSATKNCDHYTFQVTNGDPSTEVHNANSRPVITPVLP